MATVVPAILVHDVETFQQRLDALRGTADLVSIDIMDGTFVPQTSFADAQDVAKQNLDVYLELDLMVNDPLPYIRAWALLPNTVRAIVHAEITDDPRELIRAIHELGLEAGLAFLPATPITDIEHVLNDVDLILIRGNEPGASGRPLDPSAIEKIRTLRRTAPHLVIEVDIGVNLETIPSLVMAGADILVANSAIFSSKNPCLAFETLQHAAEQRSPVEKHDSLPS